MNYVTGEIHKIGSGSIYAGKTYDQYAIVSIGGTCVILNVFDHKLIFRKEMERKIVKMQLSLLVSEYPEAPKKIDQHIKDIVIDKGYHFYGIIVKKEPITKDAKICDYYLDIGVGQVIFEFDMKYFNVGDFVHIPASRIDIYKILDT